VAGEGKLEAPQPIASEFPPVPGRPVLSALRKAFCERWEHFESIASDWKRSSFRSVDWWGRLLSLAKEAQEILRWIPEPRTDEGIEAYALLLMKHGVSVMEAAAMAKQKPRGRPATKRDLAIRCLELRLEDPKKWTWRQLATDFCDCGSRRHNRNCQEAVRKEVGLLNRLLKRLHIVI
jgi:hypothetical protein